MRTASLISIYYGEDMSEEDAESLGEKSSRHIRTAMWK